MVSHSHPLSVCEICISTEWKQLWMENFGFVIYFNSKRQRALILRSGFYNWNRENLSREYLLLLQKRAWDYLPAKAGLDLRKAYCTCPSRLESFKSVKFQVRILLLSSLYYLPLLIISSTHLSHDNVTINVVRFWSDFYIINERLDYVLYIFNVKNVRK